MATKVCECGRKFKATKESKRSKCWRCFEQERKQTINPFARKKTAHRLVLPKDWSLFLQNIPSLLQLCHPDKHDGSDASRRITQWLIEARKRNRDSE